MTALLVILPYPRTLALSLSFPCCNISVYLPTWRIPCIASHTHHTCILFTGNDMSLAPVCLRALTNSERPPLLLCLDTAFCARTHAIQPSAYAREVPAVQAYIQTISRRRRIHDRSGEHDVTGALTPYAQRPAIESRLHAPFFDVCWRTRGPWLLGWLRAPARPGP